MVFSPHRSRHHHYPTPSTRFDYSCLLTLDIITLQTAPLLLQCDLSLLRIRSSAGNYCLKTLALNWPHYHISEVRSRAAADCLLLLRYSPADGCSADKRYPLIKTKP